MESKDEVSTLHSSFFKSPEIKSKIQLALGPCPGDKTARQVKCGPVAQTPQSKVHREDIMMKLLNYTALMSLLLFFTGCGDSNHSSGFIVSGRVTEVQFTASPSRVPGKVLSKAMFANFSGAVVEAFQVDDFGDRKDGVLGTSTCNASGAYMLTLPAGARASSFLVIGVLMEDPTRAMRAFVTGPTVDIDVVSEYVFRDTIRTGQPLGQVPVSEINAHAESVRSSIWEGSLDQVENMSDALRAIYTLYNPPLLGSSPSGSELSIKFAADAIIRYLEVRPNSADTVEGISCWWIDWGNFQESVAATQAALELLEQQVVVEQLRVGNRIVWRKKRA